MELEDGYAFLFQNLTRMVMGSFHCFRNPIRSYGMKFSNEKCNVGIIKA
jgi:hypothetical protein